jgi:hypothetical protein
MTGINEFNKVWGGARESNKDYFDDMMEQPVTPGSVFADSQGLADYDRITTAPTKDGSGICITMHCRACKAQGECIVGWDEVFALAHYPVTRTPPPDYAVSAANRGLFPTNLRCPASGCGAMMAPILEPHVCALQIEQALQSIPGVKERITNSELGQRTSRLMMQQQQQGR